MDSLLRKYCEKRKIVLRKGENFHILLTLAWNRVLLFKLKLHKWLHGIKKPIVHYYAVCWNEEKMLPFMFQYYDQFVDHYTIYDNYSDDRSEDIIRSHKNADIKKFSMEGGINDYIYQEIKNNCWKCSRGKADWVVVCDIDEFLYFEKPDETLKTLLRENISLPLTEGFNMYCTEYPKKGTNILRQVTKGLKDAAYDKSLIFDPHKIVEINYLPGAHIAKPTGIVNRNDEKAKVLHFKNMGLEYLLQRYHVLASRLSEKNKQQDLGTHYLCSDEKIINEFNENYSHCQPVI